MVPCIMANSLSAKLLRIEGPCVARAACCAVWISFKYSRSLRAGSPGLAALISTTSPAHKRPSASARKHARTPLEQPPQHDGSTVAIGQVMAAQANFVRVKVDLVEGAPPRPPPRGRLLCVVRGLLKKIKQSVLVGDQVRVVGIDWTDGRGMVEEVLPRRSELSDPAVANVDHVVLVFAADLPPFQPAQVTRYLVSAEAAGLPVTLVVNKADLVPPEQMQRIVDQVAGWGYEALPVSVVGGEGLPALAERLQRRVSVVAGPSGAGKSSIINALCLRSAGLEGSLEAMRAEPTRHGSASAGGSGEGDGIEGGDGGEGLFEEERRAAASRGASGAGGSGRESGGANGASSSVAWQPAERGGVAVGAGHDEDSSSGAACSREPLEEEDWAEALPGAAWVTSSSNSVSLSNPGGAGPPDLELQAVGDVSQRIGRGKHTTRNVTLLELGGEALLADTPGFNQPVLGMPAAHLGEAFPEIRQRLAEQRCTFANCQHLQEPGCAVRGNWERYAYYADLHAELSQLEDVERERAASKRRREGTVRFKSRAGGKQGAEARLETKSHRRVSRRSVKQGLSEIAKGGMEEDSGY